MTIGTTYMVRLQIEGGAEFTTLKGEVDSTRQTKAERALWISQATWQLVDWRAALQRMGRASAREVWKAWRNFQCVLQEDRRWRVQAEGSNIEELLEADRVK